MSAAALPRPVDDAALVHLVSSGARHLAAPLSETDAVRLIAYVRLIERWNATYNLTAIRSPVDMVVQHILDCLAAAAALSRRRGADTSERVLDVGSGAGLPGMVMAIVSPNRQVTCVDTVGKKTAFITQAAAQLQIRNVTALQARVETVADRYDVVVSRALASLPQFVLATRRALAEAGTWMAMKGRFPGEELAELPGDVAFEVEPLAVPGLAAERCLVWITQMKASARS